MNDRLVQKVKGSTWERRSVEPNPKYLHDRFIKIALEEALAAANEGNFGVGAVLVDEHGEIVLKGHNRVFKPYFRSDLHAEMDVMTKFEESAEGSNQVGDFVLFTSLEPCPMCFTRLITAGIGKVYYAADDMGGGMVHLLDKLPPIWQELARGRGFALAECSPELRDLASQIFLSTVDDLNRKLLERSK